MEDTGKYTYQTYGTSGFYLEDRFYSLEELKQLVAYIENRNAQNLNAMTELPKGTNHA